MNYFLLLYRVPGDPDWAIWVRYLFTSEDKVNEYLLAQPIDPRFEYVIAEVEVEA